MPPEAGLTAAVTLTALATLTLTRAPVDVTFAAALSTLLVAGVLTPAEAFAGFANPAVITVAVLYVVVGGVRETGGARWIGTRMLGRPATLAAAQLRMMTPVAALSAFLNNTPVVALMIPVVRQWAQRLGHAPSRLMIPLSYAAILGGTCTLLGTSTNLVVHGLLLERGLPGLGLFELARVALPTALLGFPAVILGARWLLPARGSAVALPSDPREYAVARRVLEGGALDGRSIEEGGLRGLQGLFLVELERDGRVLPAVDPHERLRGGDRLSFVGVVDSVKELHRTPGLEADDAQPRKLDGAAFERHLVEAVVSDRSPLLGRSIREGRFRSYYDAAVIAVARGGARLRGKIGDVVLRAGDTLLLEAKPSFAERHRNTRDFYLVSPVADSRPPRFERAATALALLAGMVLSAALGWLTLLEAALLAAGGMLLTRCVRPSQARRAVDAPVLVTIGCAFGLGRALESSGVAASVAHGLTELAGGAPAANLAALYLATALFSAVVTNNAAAVLAFPVAEGISADLGVALRPFAIAIALAASASFATPIGYQTNLMVHGPGGYRFSDFLRIGLPLTLLTGALAVLLVPLAWRF